MRSDVQPFIQTPGTLPAGRWHPGGVYAVRVGPGWLVVRDAATGREVADASRAAVDPGGRIVAVGGEAERAVAAGQAGLSLIDPFARPSTADTDLDLAGGVLREFVRGTRRRGVWPLFVQGMVLRPDDWFGVEASAPERD